MAHQKLQIQKVVSLLPGNLIQTKNQALQELPW
jgi:hypothetical protein